MIFENFAFSFGHYVTGNGHTAVTGSVTDPTTTVTIKVNNEPAASAAMTGTTFGSSVNLNPGQNTIIITASSLTGKSGSLKRTATSISNAPTLFIATPPQDSSTTQGNITITGAVADLVISASINAKVSITADGQTYTPTVAPNNTFSQTINLPTARTYAIIATATDQADNSATTQRNIIKTVNATLTKAKIYLGTDDTFTVSNIGAAVYGGPGSDSVTIADGVSGVTFDQNVERVNLAGTSGSYTFKQTGNKLNVYDLTGSTLLVTVPVQGDTDGTVLSFSDGAASALLSDGVMTLGGVAVSSTAAPKTIAPAITSVTPPAATTTKAMVYLGTDDTFTVSSSGATIYGGSGSDAVTIADGISGVILDQNVERVSVTGASGSYTFKQTGNKINIYDVAGTKQLVTVPVQGDADGTLIGFSDGAASALLNGGVMTLGGVTVSSTAAGVIAPKFMPVP